MRNFVDQHGLKAPIEVRLLDLVSEFGELAKEYLKATDYGRKQFIAGEEWELEVGDAFFALIALANDTEIDLSDALLKALGKYQTRIHRKSHPGSQP